MVAARVVALCVMIAAAPTGGCGSRAAKAPRLPPAGADDNPKGEGTDDGMGVLAKASVKFTTGERGPEGFADDRKKRREEYGGYAYGGYGYGGAMYGGSAYGGYQPNASFSPVPRPLDYAVHNLADAGAVTGTIAWAKPPAVRRLKTPCGDLDNPTLRLGTRGEAAGAIVYLDKIAKGRATPIASRPLLVGGIVEKHGCTLRPAVQVMAPVPAALTIYNDDSRDVIVARGDTGEPAVATIGPAGARQVGIQRGVTIVTDEAGRLAPAWVVAPGHPYVAITDDAGRYRIDGIVPGTYQLVVWHPPVITDWRDGVPRYGAPVVLTRTIKVNAYATARADMALVEGARGGPPRGRDRAAPGSGARRR